MCEDRFEIAANGLSFACLRAGEGDRLALCLHGFPDDAGSMRPLLDRLADAGCTAVAPYMRGYGPTGPAPDGDYSAGALGRDAVALADALVNAEGCEDAVLVGHDWGAVAGYAAARLAPDRFERLATLAVPPNFAAVIWNHPRQFLRSWYVWCFQLPVLPDRALRTNDFAPIELLWRRWSPTWDFSADRLAAVKDTFRTPGTVPAALSYYRQFVRPLLAELPRSGLPDRGPPIEVPGLVVAGTEDGCIGPALFERADRAFAADCRVLRVRGAGHFLHRERPAVVGREVVEFCTD